MKRSLAWALALLLLLPLGACGGGEYLSVSSVGKYDSSIITNTLLQKTSSLPNATESSLAMWKGAAILARADTDVSRKDRAYSETDIAFLQQTGMNFARLELDFSTLQYPNYHDDGEQVAAKQLLELDQLLAWCMKYDVHLSVAMAGLPGEGRSEPGDLFSDGDAVILATRYWKMLARRYSPISSRNLSFCLMSSPSAPTPEEYARVLSPMVDGIWEISPDRVLMTDVADAGEAEAVAALGVSVAYSFTVTGGVTAAQSWFEAAVTPIRAAAKAHSVGMMIGSLGIVTQEDLGESYYAYYGEAARSMTSNGLGWCLWSLGGGGALLTADGEFIQSGAEPVEVTVTTSAGQETRYCDARLFRALTGREPG